MATRKKARKARTWRETRHVYKDGSLYESCPKDVNREWCDASFEHVDTIVREILPRRRGRR